MEKNYVKEERILEPTRTATIVIEELLETEMIEETARRGRYCGSLFIIPKGEASIRPIFNYKSLTKHMIVPKFAKPIPSGKASGLATKYVLHESRHIPSLLLHGPTPKSKTHY